MSSAEAFLIAGLIYSAAVFTFGYIAGKYTSKPNPTKKD